MTTEEKAKHYDEAVKKVKDYYEGKTKMYSDVEQTLDLLFPKLKESKESKDERIRKELIQLISCMHDTDHRKERWLTWLEKQADKDKLIQELGKYKVKYTQEVLEKHIDSMNNKDNDKAEPKFHVGDWVVTSYGKVNQVIGVDEDGDGFTLDDDTYFSGSWKDGYHLWSIKDAKNGDVLVHNSVVFIFMGIENGIVEGMCPEVTDDILNFGEPKYDSDYCPATKEQRDTLFAEMKEVGYEWDAEKKQLRKIGQNLANSTKDCKNEDTLLSLLQQMPSCITVDGIDYHFVMKKTIAYMVFYEGEGEGSGKVIFWMTGEPVDICKEMLKRLEKEGLL